MHTLVFLDPGHFHAALTLRERHPAVDDAVAVYAQNGPELQEFLALLDAFNRRAERPTAWRPVVRAGDGPIDRLLADRPGDVVVLAGRNDCKARCMRQLHEAGFHVLADKPWMTSADALPDVRHALGGGPLVAEIMTGRHEITSILAERLVREPDVFGAFVVDHVPAIQLVSVHHLEKTVNGVPLRRPAWYFDVRVQGNGLADIPTHLVDQAQRLVGAGDLALLHADLWPTHVPRAVFNRVTGADDFPDELRSFVNDDALRYFSNADLRFRLHGVDVAITTRWDLSVPPGGGDMHTATIYGTAAMVRIEQGPDTDFRRRLFVEPQADRARVGAALTDATRAWAPDYPGLAVAPAPRGFELTIPGRLRTGHESHFPLVLDEFLGAVDSGRRREDIAGTTRRKYELLAQALTSVSRAAS